MSSSLEAGAHGARDAVNEPECAGFLLQMARSAAQKLSHAGIENAFLRSDGIAAFGCRFIELVQIGSAPETLVEACGFSSGAAHLKPFLENNRPAHQ